MYVHHMAVNETYIPVNGACFIHTDLMVKQYNYKHYYYYYYYYYFNVYFKLSNFPVLRCALVAHVNSRKLIQPMEGLFCYMLIFLLFLSQNKQILSYSSFNGTYCKLCVNLVKLFVITVT
jgi:hypothetical protein